MKRGLAFAALAAIVAAAALLGWRALRPPPSDEDQIRALLADAARAAEERRIGDALRDVSERFAGEGLDRRGVKQLVAAHVLRGSWASVTIAGAAIAPRGDAARAAVDVVLSRSGKGTPLAELLPAQASVQRFALRLERERGAWKVVGATWRPITIEEAVAGPEVREEGR